MEDEPTSHSLPATENKRSFLSSGFVWETGVGVKSREGKACNSRECISNMYLEIIIRLNHKLLSTFPIYNLESLL